MVYRFNMNSLENKSRRILNHHEDALAYGCGDQFRRTEQGITCPVFQRPVIISTGVHIDPEFQYCVWKQGFTLLKEPPTPILVRRLSPEETPEIRMESKR